MFVYILGRSELNGRKLVHSECSARRVDIGTDGKVLHRAFVACLLQFVIVLQKGYKTNIPSFEFERIVEIIYHRRDCHKLLFFPWGLRPSEKNDTMPVPPQIDNFHCTISQLGIFV